jgi:linearmycin/streptolysin S transport system permease protein
MRPFFALVLKDLKLHLSNRRALILTLAVPIAIASFFGSIFGGGSGKTKPSGIPIEVADLDHSDISNEIVTNLMRDATLRVTLVGEPEARDAIRNGKVAVAVIFPRNFGADSTRAFFRPGTKPALTVLHDPSRNIEAGMVQGILTQHIMQSVSKNVFSGEGGRQSARDALKDIDRMSGLSADDSRVLRNLLTNVDDWLGRVNTNTALGTNGAASSGFAMPFNVVEEESAAPEDKATHGYNGYSHSFGGMSMQFILMASIEWGLAILIERQHGL